MEAVATLDLDLYDMGAQVGQIASVMAGGRSVPVRAYARNARVRINAKVAAKMGFKIHDWVMTKVENVE
jgi:ABC-type uncharacterized transport system substrate-binding protein